MDAGSLAHRGTDPAGPGHERAGAGRHRRRCLEDRDLPHRGCRRRDDRRAGPAGGRPGAGHRPARPGRRGGRALGGLPARAADPGERRHPQPAERLVVVGAPRLRRALPRTRRRGPRRAHDRRRAAAGDRADHRVDRAVVPRAPAEPDPAELDFLEIMADTCAQAFQRIEASAVAATQTARLSFLAEASIELASSLDLDVTDQARGAAGGPHVRRLVRHRRRPGRPDAAPRGRARRPGEGRAGPAPAGAVAPGPDDRRGVWRVVRTGRPELIREITDEMLVAGARDEEHLRVARELNLRSALVVPLFVRGRVHRRDHRGCRPTRTVSTTRVTCASPSTWPAGPPTAIDNSELYSQTLAAAEQLQRAVLPEHVVGTQAFEIACDYHPSGRTAIGGDFYDAFPLEDGRLALFLGDVMGRGVAAAAAMAQMRAAVRAFASVDPTPAVVVAKLDHMLTRYGTRPAGHARVRASPTVRAGTLVARQRRPPAADGAAGRRRRRAAGLRRRATRSVSRRPTAASRPSPSRWATRGGLHGRPRRAT